MHEFAGGCRHTCRGEESRGADQVVMRLKELRRSIPPAAHSDPSERVTLMRYSTCRMPSGKHSAQPINLAKIEMGLSPSAFTVSSMRNTHAPTYMDV